MKTFDRDPIVGAIEQITSLCTLRQLIPLALLGSHMGNIAAAVRVEKQATPAKFYLVLLAAFVGRGRRGKTATLWIIETMKS